MRLMLPMLSGLLVIPLDKKHHQCESTLPMGMDMQHPSHHSRSLIPGTAVELDLELVSKSIHSEDTREVVLHTLWSKLPCSLVGAPSLTSHRAQEETLDLAPRKAPIDTHSALVPRSSHLCPPPNIAPVLDRPTPRPPHLTASSLLVIGRGTTSGMIVIVDLRLVVDMVDVRGNTLRRRGDQNFRGGRGSMRGRRWDGADRAAVMSMSSLRDISPLISCHLTNIRRSTLYSLSCD